jgi:tRNA(Glu) U13 pseudouridine synthase TruD
LLQGDWEKAITQILMPRACESDAATRARRLFADTGDAQATLSILPPFMHVEKMLLNGIKAHGKVCLPGLSERTFSPLFHILDSASAI